MGGTHPGRARERDRGPAEPGASGLSPAAQVEGGCPMDVRTTIDQVVRASYGRLVAFLAARSRDVAGAEDALAAAFLVQPSAMSQRLTRAKAKIRDARVAFELPCAAELPQRLDAVLGAIYAAYGTGWEDVEGADRRRDSLAAEAIALGRLLLQMMPHEPEVKGLLALMLHCAARCAARRSANGP